MTSAIPDSHADLLEAPLATLATVGPDGRPQVTSVWFLAEGGQVRFSLNTMRQKTKNLQANPVISVHIQDAVNPGRYLEVRGDARIEPDDDYAFVDRVGAKYGGVDLRAMDAGNGRRVVVTVEPVRCQRDRPQQRIRARQGLRNCASRAPGAAPSDEAQRGSAEAQRRPCRAISTARRRGRWCGRCPRSGRRGSGAPSRRRGPAARSTDRPRARGSHRPALRRAGSSVR